MTLQENGPREKTCLRLTGAEASDGVLFIPLASSTFVVLPPKFRPLRLEFFSKEVFNVPNLVTQ